MNRHAQFYIGGRWVEPAAPATLEVIDPSTEQPFTAISLGSKADVDRAVDAAKAAFADFSATSRESRLGLLRRILDCYNDRSEDLAQAVSREMGAPLAFAREAQVWAGRVHLEATIEALETYEFSRLRGTSLIVKEPIGRCGADHALELALEPDRLQGRAGSGGRVHGRAEAERNLAGQRRSLFAEIVDAAGAPAGVFNLLNGTGPMSDRRWRATQTSTWSRSPARPAQASSSPKTAADTVKRVAQELGGKSPNIILRDADLEDAVTGGVAACFSNSGQSCDAPSRMLAPAERHEEALRIAAEVADRMTVGDPTPAGRRSRPGRQPSRSSTRSSA